MDNEVKGEGNSLNYKYRMHDPRLGRFFAIDPLTAKYPWYSPYQFAGNKVMQFIELEGLEEKITPYLSKIEYKVVFEKDDETSVLERISNAIHNTTGILANVLVADTYNASSWAINNSYWMISGQKNYDFHNTFISPIGEFERKAFRYHNETPISQQFEDAGNTLVDLKNWEGAVGLLIGFKFILTKTNTLSPKNFSTQGLAATTEKATTSFSHTITKVSDDFLHVVINSTGEALPDMHIFASLKKNGTHLEFNVDVIPDTVLNGLEELIDSHAKYKGKYARGLYKAQSDLLKIAKKEGFETARFSNKRETGLRRGEVQKSKTYNLENK